MVEHDVPSSSTTVPLPLLLKKPRRLRTPALPAPSGPAGANSSLAGV
ncbi:hypothetical protein SSAG_03473 [Streptomyces sp. Mg1]|nr:hypothetical protein SSAG_03473 [Streptomyces sp. Mg1]